MFTAIIKNPVWYFKVLVKKVLKLIGRPTVNLFATISPTEAEFGKGWLGYIKAYPLIGIAMVCARLFEWGIISLGIIGIYLSRKSWKLILPILIVPVYYFVVQINFYPSLSYYFPMYPFILIFSALFVKRIWQYFQLLFVRLGEVD